MEGENITNEFLAFRESQWTSNGSNIYLQTGSVGIGTLAPRATLDVYGSINAISANFGTIYTAGTTLASLNVTGISNLLGNVTVGNLIVTGNLVNVVSNTQFSNAAILSPIRNTDGTISLVEDPVKVENWRQSRFRVLRDMRDTKLTKCDWTQTNDVQLTDEKKESWRLYRQALRDLPSITQDPDNPSWPIPPQ